MEAVIGTDAEREAKRLAEAYSKESMGRPWGTKPGDLEAGNAILNADARTRIAVVFALQQQIDYNWFGNALTSILIAQDLPWTTDDLERLLKHSLGGSYWRNDWDTVIRLVHRFVEQGQPLTIGMEESLQALSKQLENAPRPDLHKLRGRVQKALGEDNAVMPDLGEAWSGAALADIGRLPLEEQMAWKRLFAHAQTSEKAKCAPAWRKAARVCIDTVGIDRFRAAITHWFPLVTVPSMKTVEQEDHGRIWTFQQSSGSDRNVDLLKGLAWMCADRSESDVARALASLVEGCLRKQPGVGPWAVRVALGAIWALTEMDCAEAIGQLGRLKTKVTFRTALNVIEKGLETAAQRAGVSKAELEDLSVPAYGFAQDGTRREEFGECVATAVLTSRGDLSVEWFGANGKPVKSVPTVVKKEHAAALKEFKADIDAAGKMLTAQKARFDGFYLPERGWMWKDWTHCFGEHPLLGHIARRLIWHFAQPNGERKAQGLWSDELKGFADARGEGIDWLADDTQIRLWHPIGFSVADVLAWRDVLQERHIVQPFKQAYREVYLLTEAELRTQTYSNRFAGHILKQHQMNSLAALRGWKNKLRLMVDDTYPPASKELTDLNLRAEFWIEGAGENYDTDATESGSYLYLTTDQVRFYPVNSAENYAHAGGGGYSAVRWGQNADSLDPLPLTEVPALVFSEIMRDIDLFVGVCSVGNDPAWQDGGPQGQYQDYWTSYSFGELSATAQTRSDVLARLLPRLKIAGRCTLKDRFLVVRGDLRTYKIHLGSGNILMEPNDQYLCIVQGRSAVQNEEPVKFLPFEGDQRLALILSKAFLLADDTRITDETITRQIKV